MATSIFPLLVNNRVLGWRGITWGLTKKPAFKTSAQVALTGREAMQQNWTRAKWDLALRWSLLKNKRTDAANVLAAYPRNEYKLLTSFFEARRGRFEPFFLSFTTDGDCYTAAQLLVASTPAVGTDPSNMDSRNFQGVATFGTATRPIGGFDVTTSTPALVQAPSTPLAGITYNFPKDGWFRLASALAPGSVINGTFNYYYRVAFKRDDAEFETFADDFWRLKSINFETRWW